MTGRSSRPVPDGLVVLTFDGANKSDIATVAPILRDRGFGATFFINEGLRFSDPALNDRFMIWAEIRALHEQGFEIGNHTKSRLDLTLLSAQRIREEIAFIQDRCEAHRIPAPTTFCYPGFSHAPHVVDVVAELGFSFARRGGGPEYSDGGRGARGPAYDPSEDHPLLIPTTGYAGPEWTLDDLVWAVDKAQAGKIASICFHGVPGRHCHRVSTEVDSFAAGMRYLDDAGCTVIACRDLAEYVDPEWARADPYEAVDRRVRFAAADARCEHRVDPLGVDQPAPVFGWRIRAVAQARHPSAHQANSRAQRQSSHQTASRSMRRSAYPAVARAQRQSAYRVLVSSTRQGLEAGIADKWDSGQVASDATTGVAYAGAPLRSGERCWWKVQVWDGAGRQGADSPPASFEMGLLKTDDWTASWISGDADVSAPLLRKEITLAAPARRARCRVTGLGYYELYVNGHRVGEQVLDPATTYYHNDQPFELSARVLYATHNVTRHLRPGPNAIGLMLGHGWYSAERDVPPSPSHREPYGDRPIGLVQLDAELDSGELVRCVTDSTWTAAAGPVRYNDYSHGETYDARMEQPGWSEPGFDDRAWAPARLAAAPSGRLRGQPIPPIRVVRTIEPVAVARPEAGVATYDFGQNLTGWTRLRVSGPGGARVTVRHGHGIREDGRLDNRSNMYAYPDDPEYCFAGLADGDDGFEHGGEGFHHGARQTNEYVLAGRGSEVWEPRFTLHGFRYAEVACDPGEVSVEAIEARQARTSVAETGSFDCSDLLINRIHSNVVWTFASSLQGYPQDAADRSERVGWLGDPVASDFGFTFDTIGFWSKWLDDIADVQKASGDLPVIAPLHWRRTHDAYLMYPVWKSSYPLVAWDLYLETGDAEILERHYERIEALVAFLGGRAAGCLLTEGLGDHMEPQPDGTSAFAPVHTPAGLTSSAYYYRDTRILTRAGEVLGYQARAERYRSLAADIRVAFNRRYLDAATGNYATGSQASNAIPLALGLVPAEYQKQVLDNIVTDILNGHEGHLSTGMLGTDALARILPEHGRADVLHTIVTQTTFPSWGEQIGKGATTLWEAWEGETDPQLSYNMKLFGSIQKYFFQSVAGIRRDAPGYAAFTVAPQAMGGLRYARASVNTVRGPISVKWRRKDGGFRLDASVPPNTRAAIRIPKLGAVNPSIIESDRLLWQNRRLAANPDHPGITEAAEEAEAVRFDVGSGDYSFFCSPSAGRYS